MTNREQLNIIQLHVNGTEVEMLNMDGKWEVIKGEHKFDFLGHKYRKKEDLIPWNRNDIPKTKPIWLRCNLSVDHVFMLIEFTNSCILRFDGKAVSYKELFENYEWSFDCISWKKCAILSSEIPESEFDYPI